MEMSSRLILFFLCVRILAQGHQIYFITIWKNLSKFPRGLQTKGSSCCLQAQIGQRGKKLLQ